MHPQNSYPIVLNPNCLVGIKIRETRLSASLSQTKLATLANQILSSMGAIALPMQNSAIARIESGDRELKYLEAWAIAQVLNVETEWFLPKPLN